MKLTGNKLADADYAGNASGGYACTWLNTGWRFVYTCERRVAVLALALANQFIVRPQKTNCGEFRSFILLRLIRIRRYIRSLVSIIPSIKP